MASNKKGVSDAAEILRRRYFEGKPEMEALLDLERANADVARKVYLLRVSAGLTQGQLAKLVGTAPSVISRLEDADYEGHSLSMLRRVAQAVGRRVEIRFPVEKGAPVKAARNPAKKTGSKGAAEKAAEPGKGTKKRARAAAASKA